MSVLGAGFFGPTEGEGKRRQSSIPPAPPADWRAMCGDRVITDDGWTGRVVAQYGPYSWVSMEATNSPRTCATAMLRAADPEPTAEGERLGNYGEIES